MKLRDAIETHLESLRQALARSRRLAERHAVEVSELDRQISELETILAYDLKLNHIGKATSEGTSGEM